MEKAEARQVTLAELNPRNQEEQQLDFQIKQAEKYKNSFSKDSMYSTSYMKLIKSQIDTKQALHAAKRRSNDIKLFRSLGMPSIESETQAEEKPSDLKTFKNCSFDRSIKQSAA